MTIDPGAGGAPTRPRRVLGPLQEFLQTTAAGGLALLIATVAALVWANVAPDSYTELWGTPITLDAGALDIATDLKTVVKNVLMSVFFLVVGLEIKRELTVGELKDRRVALLPLFAAIGGMALPAALYLAVNAGGPGQSGWGIPMATDIAFAVAALRLLGTRVPAQLAAFLLALAVIDDIGAILVIAVAYTSGLAPAWLAAAVLLLALVGVLAQQRVSLVTPYVILGLGAWACMSLSGVSPTIAAVAFGLLIPVRALRPRDEVAARAGALADDLEGGWHDEDLDRAAWRGLGELRRDGVPLLERMEHALTPWSSFVVLPIFALAFAGIRIDADSVQAALESRVTLGVVLGLVVGKTLGVLLGTLVAVALRIGRLPGGVTWPQVAGVGALAGIGFTVSIFVANLAFTDPALVADAKMGILAASVVAAVIGTLILLTLSRRGAPGEGEAPRTAGPP